MKFNKWVSKIKRLKISRPYPHEFKRLDFAERLINFEEKKFKQFINNLTQEDFITYPSYGEYEKLLGSIAKINKVKKNKIYFDSGSDACIKNLIHLFCKNKTNIVSTTPSFPMYKIYSSFYNIDFRAQNFDKKININLNKIYKKTNKKTSLVIITNPNSPFGDYKTTTELEKLISKLKIKKIPIVIDEAYVEFSPGSCIRLLNKYDNLFILRTFSKAWGAAGARLGYVIGNDKYIKLLNSIQLTYPVSNSSIKFINFLIKNKFISSKYAKDTIRSRDNLCKILTKKNYDVISSNTNSIHFHEKYTDNTKTIMLLKRNGFTFKHGSAKTGTPVMVPGDKRKNWIRISIGPGLDKDKHFLNSIKDNQSQI